ncbi:hypothetical protein Ssi02_52150 [Sinosporangium siamense]|uniref:Uncharacterized protein n=1 Tax=Sinosporangium siamense TaxID=1367973 RepID=A0A919VEC4_9ACTN|nr:hypothetical protein Ssi02_52150 [Sinosporangium siamense]
MAGGLRLREQRPQASLPLTRANAWPTVPAGLLVPAAAPTTEEPFDSAVHGLISAVAKDRTSALASADRHAELLRERFSRAGSADRRSEEMHLWTRSHTLP